VQQKLPFLLTSQNKSSDATDALPQKKARVLPGILTDMNMESQKVHQSFCHDKLVTHEQKNLASFDTPTHKDRKNQSHEKGNARSPAPNVVLVSPSDMNQHLHDLLHTGKGADVVFEAGGESFAAHRCLLAARSPVFSAELFGSMKEGSTTNDPVRIDGIEPQVFRALLCFLYTDSLPKLMKEEEGTMCQHLLVAADRYGMERLKLICEDKLCKHINVGTLANILALAEAHHCHVLKSACFGFLGSKANLTAVMASDGFVHLKASCPSVVKELFAMHSLT
jgi:speckle-type POZ protein